MANLIATNLFCKNKEDFKKLLMMLIQTRVLSGDVTMNAVDMEHTPYLSVRNGTFHLKESKL